MRLNRLPTWQKLALLAIPCMLLAAVPAVLYLRELHAQAAQAGRGAEGARNVKAVLEVVRLAQLHRGLSSGVLAGNAAMAAPRDAKKAEVAAALAAMVSAAPPDRASIRAGAAAISSTFNELAAAVDARTLTAAESFRRHTELIARTLNHLEEWLDLYGLTFADDPVTHYLVVSAYQHLPALTEAMGQARAHGTAMLSARNPSVQDRLFAAALLDRALERGAAARSGILKASATDRGLGDRAAAHMNRVEADTRATVGTARRELVDAATLTYPAADYFALTTRAIDGQFKLLDQLAGDLVQGLTATAAARAEVRNLMLGGGILLTLLVAGFAVAITRAITRPLSHAVEVAGRIASGRLDNDIWPEGRDEVSSLLAALADMQANLVAMVEQIQQTGFAIRDASAQVAAGNADLSSRTEEQASTLEQTAANMEEITTTVRQNATSAHAAIDLASAAASQARQGGELVARVVETMAFIAESSKRVRDITDTIDGFAFQTNLLALNAAVEAARAGEHGRGFAVVASEVRLLAQRCAQAAQEIRGLVQSSGAHVENGCQQAHVAGTAVGLIVTSVQDVAQRVTDIAAASSEQRAGIEQVNQAVVQMEGVTQQNAALVEEAAASAYALEQQAAELAAAVARFTTGAEGLPVEPAVQAAAQSGDRWREALTVEHGFQRALTAK